RLPSPAHRLPEHDKLSLARLSAAVGKPKKVKGLRLSFSPPTPIWLRIPAKLNQACLLRVKFQPKAGQQLPKPAYQPFSVFLSLKPNNEVIRKPHHDHVPSRFSSPPLLNPKIKHIVQIDVGQKRTNASALDRPYLTLYSLTFLQHPARHRPHHSPSTRKELNPRMALERTLTILKPDAVAEGHTGEIIA